MLLDYDLLKVTGFKVMAGQSLITQTTCTNALNCVQQCMCNLQNGRCLVTIYACTCVLENNETSNVLVYNSLLGIHHIKSALDLRPLEKTGSFIEK